MAEGVKTNQGGGTTGVIADKTAGNISGGAGNIVVDKNKSAEQYIKDTEAFYIVPALVRERFPDLVKLIYETESMNQEEREYWLQILPIMTEEQIVKFRGILVNEKDQLVKLDQEYEQEMARINKPPVIALDETKIKEEMAKVKEAEKASETKEQQEEEELLKKLQGME